MSKHLISAISIVVLLAFGGDSIGAESPQFPQQATFTTLITTPRALEGLTGDDRGNLYTGGSGASPCPVWKINLASPTLVPVGFVPTALAATCGFSGITFNDLGDLFVADGGAGRIYSLTPNAATPPNAAIYASGIPGTNGLAFDRAGNLWTGDGTTGQGRVWKITGSGANCTPPAAIVNCQEVFRIQPMANEVNLVSGVGGVGRDVRDLPPGTITVTPTSRNAANTLGSQAIVANGIAFNNPGEMFVIDTARGALWKVQFDRQGNLTSPIGCDTTFPANTLCLSNVFVAHPILEGGDGIVLDVAGNVWVAANERNAIAVVTKDGRVTEVFRNSVNSAKLRNAADTALGNTRILEFPTSPFISGKIFCTSNSDGDRRDNSPRLAGEIDAGGAGARGKISCMDQELTIPGLPLPVR